MSTGTKTGKGSVAAVEAFKKAEEKLAKESDQKTKANVAELISSLEAAQKEVTQAGELDEAIRIRDAVKALQNEKEPRPQPPKQKRNRIPPGAVVFQGHHYFVDLTPCSWRVACKKCEEAGGHLVTLETPAEYKFVAHLRGNRAAYIGATRDTETGAWEWINGQPCGVIPWAPGQPNNGPEEVFLGFEHGIDLHDWLHSNKLGFICEWDE